MLPVLYSCRSCGLENVQVLIKERKPHKDIAEWMKQLTWILAEDHRARSPLCMVRQLSHVKIPIEKEGGYIGGPVKKIDVESMKNYSVGDDTKPGE